MCFQHINGSAGSIGTVWYWHYAGDMQRCEEGCSRVLQKLQGCGCSGLQALILTQRAACRLLRSSLEGAWDDCRAALAAEPGSADALHLMYQARLPSYLHAYLRCVLGACSAFQCAVHL